MSKNYESQEHPLHDYYSGIYRRYDIMNRLFTFRQDERWRYETAKHCINDKPEQVLDLCCGTGDLALKLASLAGNEVQITGYDFNLDMLSKAEKKIKARKITNIKLINGDAASMPFPDGQFDAVTIGFGFRNLTYQNANSDKHVMEINRVLRPGGKLYIVESGVPDKAFVRFFYNLYLQTILIPLGGLVSGNWKAYNPKIKEHLRDLRVHYFRNSDLKNLLPENGSLARQMWLLRKNSNHKTEQ